MLVIGSLVVVVWRGLWVVCDLVIYPEQLAVSAWASVVSSSNVRETKFHIDEAVNRTGTISDLRHFDLRPKYELKHKWNQEIIQ